MGSQITLRVPDELKARLEAFARATHQDFSTVMRAFLIKSLDGEPLTMEDIAKGRRESALEKR